MNPEIERAMSELLDRLEEVCAKQEAFLDRIEAERKAKGQEKK